MRELMKDLGERTKEIKAALDTPTAAPTSTPDGDAEAQADAAAAEGTSLKEKEALLDELVEIVESIDQARDLHKVGGLETLLSLMRCPHPSLRWRAAEVAATCMAGNPPVQRWFMDGGAAPALMAMAGDGDAACRTKALLALSAMVRHYRPGLEAFRLAGGLGKLLDAIGAAPSGAGGTQSAEQQEHQQQQAVAAAAASGSGGREDEAEDEAGAEAAAARRRLRRKALALLQYVLTQHPADCAAAAELGAVEALEAQLRDPAAGSDLRAAALEVLVEIASHPDGWGAVKAREPGLQALVADLARAHGALSEDDRAADAEEGAALAALGALLAAPAAPKAAKAAAGDHVDLDPWQDGQEQSKTVPVGAGAGAAGAAVAGAGAGSGGQQGQSAQRREQQQPLALGPPPAR
ncbi:hypothetical protein MNEG_4796 [Monoraphidium neglectum]|uniref:Nucleotide exchange factor Fes1 domain-containing protein n=1 Tax=Monoraphidium neglectum TaxID=145388 RepID=A0A0D2MRZ2_9CHLO|nr:hypothetical protein MNEG_4796 [Monoraphidium neglectum]KIZ03162.1 hypothetical protein MNEG_4796 [Monoraphidium neglectum]|eukprot:XP_013902181.1 hypothetical protein MNEG_4796 [Monoraphidium neglectum]